MENSYNVKLKYLFILEPELDRENKLINLLQSRSSIKIDSNQQILKFNEFEGMCSIKSIEKKQYSSNSYFTIEITFDKLESAEKVNREINRIFSKFNNDKVLLLADGISRVYSSRAYSLLHEVETSLRSFITELMMFSNPNWLDEIKKILDLSSDKNKSGVDVLYNRNFDQLREFLFTGYSDTSYDDYLKELEALMKEFFANQPLPRGLYAVKIAKYKEDKLVRDSGVYHVRIDNRQVVKLLQKLE